MQRQSRGAERPDAVLILHEVKLDFFRQIGEARQTVIENRAVHQLRAFIHELFE